jgi:hypothetical protein
MTLLPQWRERERAPRALKLKFPVKTQIIILKEL